MSIHTVIPPAHWSCNRSAFWSTDHQALYWTLTIDEFSTWLKCFSECLFSWTRLCSSNMIFHQLVFSWKILVPGKSCLLRLTPGHCPLNDGSRDSLCLLSRYPLGPWEASEPNLGLFINGNCILEHLAPKLIKPGHNTPLKSREHDFFFCFPPS